MADAPAPEPDELNPRVALCVAAHPDDLDFCMAGTIAKWAADGCAVYYLILTNGNKGSADPGADQARLAETRRSEQQAAAQILGVKDVYFCDYNDGLLEPTMDVKRDIVRIIRKVRPDVVMTIDPDMLYDARVGFINHSDHRAAGLATLDAVYPLARDILSFPELAADEDLQPHNTAALLFFNYSTYNYSVDIAAFSDKKAAALAAHASQMPAAAQALERMQAADARSPGLTDMKTTETFQRINIS